MLPVFLPYGALLNAAFSKVSAKLMTWSNMSMHNVHFTFFELSQTWSVMGNTFLLPRSRGRSARCWHSSSPISLRGQAVRGHRVLGFLATAPIAIPGIVLRRRPLPGLHAVLAQRRRHRHSADDPLRHALDSPDRLPDIELPASYQQLGSAIQAVHPELEEASRILGATRIRALRQITAPLLLSGVVATWCFIFVAVVRELSAAVILFTSDTKVLSVLIFDLKESGDLGAIAVLGLVMLAITTIVIWLANLIPGAGGATPRLRAGG